MTYGCKEVVCKVKRKRNKIFKRDLLILLIATTTEYVANISEFKGDLKVGISE